jgi:hypothetical protein
VGLRIPTLQVGESAALLLAAVALLSRSQRPEPVLAESGQENSVVLRVDSGLELSQARAEAYGRLLSTLESTPGTRTVSLTSAGALLGLGTMGDVTTDCGQCYFGGIQLRWPHFTALAHAVSADSFRAAGIPLVAGRSFASGDTEHSARIAVVNRQLARRYFQGGDAIGRALYLGPGWPNAPYTVIGVVDDERASAIGGALQPRETVYFSVRQHPPRVTELLLESDRGFNTQAIALIRESLGSQSHVNRLGTRESYRATQERVIRWFGASFAVSALLILVMALIGTFAVSRLWADAMGWELALRRAVGASRRRMVGLVLWRMAAIGAGSAALGAFCYATILLPALAESLPQITLGVLPRWLAVMLLIGLLALTIGAIPGLRRLWRAPSDVLR